MAASARVEASTPEARRRMQRIRQKNTSAEAALRRELHARGIRYRIHVPVLTKPAGSPTSRSAGSRVAVFVDGCFCTAARHDVAQAERRVLAREDQANMARQRHRRASARRGWKVIRVWARGAQRSLRCASRTSSNAAARRMRRP